MRKILLLCITALVSYSWAIPCWAVKIKIGVIAPEGTTWANNLKAMTKEIDEQTKGEVEFKIYYGGSQGDEPDVLRKTYAGQLHGGFFTGKTLGEINGDVRVFEVPFTFYSDHVKAGKVIAKLTPLMNAEFEKKNFTNLGFFELGPVYLVSRKEVKNLDDLKKLKLWSWQGDLLANALIESMDLNSVPLALPDVLSSLSTGIIDAAYSPPLAVVAMQWHSKVKYLVDFPVSYATGAMLITSKIWREVKKEHQVIVRQVSQKYLSKVNDGNAQENLDALSTMKSMGIQVIKMSDADIEKAKAIRGKIVKKLEGPLFSKKAFEAFEAARKD